MKCARILPRLSGYLEGDLVEPRRERVAEHLDACADCARELAQLRRTVALLRSLPEPEPSPMLAAAVMRRLRAGEGRSRVWDRWWSRIPDLGTPRFAVPIGALASLVLYASLSGISSLRPADIADIAARDAPAAPVLRADPAAPSAFPPAPPSVTVPAQPARLGGGNVAAPGAPTLRLLSPGVGRSVQRSSEGTGPNKAERGRRELDRRLDLLLQSPEAFAALLMSDSVAAQELWMVELADRAVARGIDGSAVLTLRDSEDPASRALADTLAAAVWQARERQARSAPAGSAR